jgi:hypothetical protein
LLANWKRPCHVKTKPKNVIKKHNLFHFSVKKRHLNSFHNEGFYAAAPQLIKDLVIRMSEEEQF